MQHKEQFHLYKFRFVELALYCAATILSMTCWLSLQPIEPQLKEGYGVDSNTTVAVGNVFMVLYVFFFFPATICLDMYGLKTGVLIGMILTSIGMVLKALINQSFTLFFVGQVIAAIGHPFLLNAPAKLAALWFGKNERVIAVTVAVMSQTVGIALGLTFPLFFVYETSDDAAQQIIYDQDFIYQNLYWQAVAGSVLGVLSLVFFQEKPLTPPSSTSAEEVTTFSVITQKARDIFKNRSAVLLIVAFGVNIAIQNVFGVTIGLLASAFGFTSDDASFFGGIFMAGGLIGSLIFGVIVEKTKKYLLMTILIQLLTVLSIALLIVAFVQVQKAWFVNVSCFFLGFTMNPSVPVGIDFLVELTHPIPESISSGLLMVSSNAFGIFFGVIAGSLVDNYGANGALALLVMLLAMAFITFVLALFIKEDLKRLKESILKAAEGEKMLMLEPILS